MPEPLLVRYLQPLLAGRRAECIGLIQSAISEGRPAERILSQVVWPAMNQIDRLYREDQINAAIENMATRINRTVAVQLQAHLPALPPNGKRVLLTCIDVPHQETGAQIIADLLQSRGWEVFFLGTGSVPGDEILTLVGEVRPHVLVLFGSQPQSVPEIRALIDHIREIGVCPTMNVVLSGGVFNRADDLWREVGADAFADTAPRLVEVLEALPARDPRAPRSIGIVKQRRRRRKQPSATTPAARIATHAMA
jgi:methanogenic corrinoid protein MtbC1